MVVVDSPVSLRRQVFVRKVVFHLVKANQLLVDKIAEHHQVSEAKLVDKKIVATIEDPEAHNPELIRILVGEGADLQFIGELRRSLEDVYLQLVKNA